MTSPETPTTVSQGASPSFVTGRKRRPSGSCPGQNRSAIERLTTARARRLRVVALLDRAPAQDAARA